VPMNRGNEGFGILHAEGLDPRAVGLLETCTAQTARGVELLRMVAVTEVKGAAQDADRVVVVRGSRAFDAIPLAWSGRVIDEGGHGPARGTTAYGNVAVGSAVWH